MDKPDQNNNDSLVEVVFQHNEELIRFDAEYYPSPLSTHFKKDLSWYFTDYLYNCENGTDDRRISEKILSLGRYMGDQLLGENHQLLRVKDIIEDVGYEHLSVSIESSRIIFFSEQWEMLILPEASFVLSTVCKNFSRQFSLDVLKNVDAELNFELSKESPLTILHIVSRPNFNKVEPPSSQSLQNFVNLLGSEGAIRYEICAGMDWTGILTRLAELDYPIHIIHFDGPIKLENGQPYLLLEGLKEKFNQLSVKSLSQTLNQHSVALLSIDSQGYINMDDGSVVDADIGLAAVSHVALNEGVGNVMGVNSECLPEISSRCFTAIFRYIAAGFELGQAIVEARKSVQSEMINNDFSNESKPFQFWSLPVFYRGSSNTFFSQPQVFTELYESENYNDIRQRLFGFKDSYLPPKLVLTSDRQLPKILSGLHYESLIYISGGEGSGKTSLGHQAAFYLTCIGDSKFGFYFDFSTGFYAKEDVLQMIKPILSLDLMATTPSVFLFDNLDTSTTSDVKKKDKETLLAFITELHKQGHKVIACGQEDECLISVSRKFPVGVPSQSEQQHHLALLTKKCSSQDIPINKNLLTLVQKLKGNPFLMEKITPMLARQPQENFASELADVLDTLEGDKVIELFFRWQWEKIPETYQKLFMVLIDIPEVLLEMIDVVANKKIESNPVKELVAFLSSDLSRTNTISFTEAIKYYDEAGFLQQYPHGRVVSSRFKSFVYSYRQQDPMYNSSAVKISLMLSKVLCVAVATLVPHLQSQEGSPIKQNFLMNRGVWARHLETVWFAQELDVFLPAKTALFSLMKQENLANECADWAENVIGRSEWLTPNSLLSGEDRQGATLKVMSWLNLVTEGLNKPNETIEYEENANVWLLWLEEEQSDNIPLLFTVIHYLESFYSKTSSWHACRRVNQRAISLFQLKESWSNFIQSSKSLANCYYQLGEYEQALNSEDQMLTLPPFDRNMSSLKDQLILETVARRIHYQQLEKAQTLLNGIEYNEGNDPLDLAVKNLQSEIFIKEKKFEDAVPILQHLKTAYEVQGHTEAVNAVLEKIRASEEMLTN